MSAVNNIYSNVSAFPWRKAIKNCKSEGVYPIGNFNLSNVGSACENLSNDGPGWVGVVRDQYFLQDQGKFCVFIFLIILVSNAIFKKQRT